MPYMQSLPRKLMMIIYQCVWHLIAPFALIRLWLKGRKEPSYRQNISERFGFYPKVIAFQDPIWLHAVSVGETRAATPFILKLLEQGQRVLLTHMTPTGRKLGSEIFQDAIAAKQLMQVYLPYDFCWPVGRFYRYFRPRLGLLMETEVWPYLILFAKQKNMPIYLINGRLSERSARRFAHLEGFSREVFQSFTEILAQTPGDAKRYQAFTKKPVRITGNLKFDAHLDKNLVELGAVWKRSYWPNRVTICAASTRDGEESLILKAWQQVDKTQNPLLMIVPRHMQRLDEVVASLQSQQLRYELRTQLHRAKLIDVDVLIGDTMGEMAAYLESSDVVVMGGTLQGTGGQNLIEPCSLGKPVILGPSTYNFAQVSHDALQLGAALSLGLDPDLPENILTDQLAQYLNQLISEPEKRLSMSIQGLQFSKDHQGATRQTLEILGL